MEGERMALATGIPLPRHLKKTLGLARRSIPEFYESVDSVLDVPHASAIRAALESSVPFCGVDSGAFRKMVFS